MYSESEKLSKPSHPRVSKKQRILLIPFFLFIHIATPLIQIEAVEKFLFLTIKILFKIY